MTTEAWAALVFYIVAVAAIAGAVRMVISSDMIHSALSLVLALGAVAVLFLLLSADFLAMVQLLVYVGAIMILMLFAIMLTPGQVELPALAERFQRLSALAVAGLFGVIALVAIFAHPWSLRPVPLDTITTPRIGELLMTTYVLPFEIASVLLTAGMIGAIVIARED